MARESFIFYASFDEALRELPDDARLKVYDAIFEYAFRGTVKVLKGVEKAIFALIRPQMDANNKRYENGCKGAEAGKKGGAPKGNANAKKTTENNPKTTAVGLIETTPKQPQNNPKTTPNENDNVNDNVNVNENVNYTPFFISPQGEKKTKNFEELFFEKYPKYAGAKFKKGTIDFQRLMEEFEKSTYLRNLYTFKQVMQVYTSILAGEFRDKEKANPFAGIEEKAARERWYSERRGKAEIDAEKILNTFLGNDEFKTLYKRLKVLNCEIGQQEAKFELGDEKAKKKLIKLEQEKWRTKQLLGNILDANGKTEEDLLPKWHCKKCKDTGFMEDGKACDCYEKAKVSK